MFELLLGVFLAFLAVDMIIIMGWGASTTRYGLRYCTQNTTNATSLVSRPRGEDYMQLAKIAVSGQRQHWQTWRTLDIQEAPQAACSPAVVFRNIEDPALKRRR